MTTLDRSDLNRYPCAVVVDVVREFFRKQRIDPCAVLVAVSGGADSTALLAAMAELRPQGFALIAGHVNHHLRGEESEGDERFVRDLCRRLDVPLEVEQGPLDPEHVRARGVEAAAREIRYARLHSIRDRTSAQLIATAHQRNDQAETVLMRMIAGGGIAALRGIHPLRTDGVVRPLLEVGREAIEQFLRDRGLTYRSDTSNRDPRFLRNRIRQFLAGLDASDALAALAIQARDVWVLLDQVIDDIDRASVAATPDEARFLRFPEERWLRQALLHRHIRRLDPDSRGVGAKALMRIGDEIEAIRRLSVTRSLEFARTGDALVLRRRPAATPRFELALGEDLPAYIPELGITLHLTRVSPAAPAGDRQRIQVPPGGVPSFVVRNRRDGDRFQPLGMHGSKKLKELLIDRKIPAEQRDRLPLLLVDDEIAWVAGIEVSERFKVTDGQGTLYEVWTEDAGAADDRGDHSPFHG